MALTASQIAERLLKKVQGVADTKFPLTVRSVLEEATSTYNLVTPDNIWTQASDIPSTPPVLSPINGSASSGVVKYYEKLLLVQNDGGSVNSFRSPGGELADAISGRFGFDYNFKVYNTAGTQQVFKGDWLVDSESGIITFYNINETLNESPSVTINNSNPPRITFYKYIGSKGFGSGSGVGTILGVTAGVGLTGGGTAGYITLDINLGVDSGLTFSGDNIVLDTNIAGNGLDFSSGVLTVNTSEITNTLAGSGITSSGGVLNVSLGVDSGLTFSGDNIILDTNIAGNGLDFSSGVLTVNTSEINSGLAGNGLTANGSALDVNVNSDSLEIVNDVIRLKDTITGDRIFQNDLTVIGDVFVQGSFSVAGSASVINTSSLVVSDPIIALGHSQSGAPLLDEGFMFVRGTGVTQAFIWDESDDTFALISTNNDHTLIGNVDILGYSNLRLGGLSASQIEITSGAQQDYVLVSDQNGLASWTSSILKAGTGLIKNGATVSLDYVTITGTGLTQNGNQISIDTNGFASSLAGDGLSANGGTLSVNVGNGLSIVSDTIYLGGTLSQNTIINGSSFDLTIQDFDILTLTGSVIDVQLDNGLFLVDVGVSGSIDLYGGDITIFATGSVDIITTNEFTISTGTGSVTTLNSEGLVYTSDYSSTFVTNSLVTKKYVDDAVSVINGDLITGVTAGNGLSGGGTSGFITLGVNLGVDSGLTFSGDNIILDTNIAGNGLDFTSGVLTVNTSEINSALAGNGLTSSGSTLDVNVNPDSLEIVNDVIRLKDTITGDRTFQDSVIVNGNFTVNGTASYVYTENLIVEDPLILLAGTQTGTPTLDAGLIINRGNGATQGFIWDESAGEFAVITTNDSASTQGNINISTYSNFRANQLQSERIKLTEGAQLNYILISDAQGLASWTASIPGTSGTSGTSATSGTSGTTGTSGTSGTTGTSGTSGTSATSGTSGTSATSGTSGTRGTSGTSGTSGLSGVDGTSGTSATSGTSGTSATSGTSGTSATSGTSGTTGTSGTSATSGTSGTSATSGTSGTSATSGTSGTSGISGVSGTSGTTGTSGTSGTTGTSGTSGTTGTSGTSGTTGTSGTSGTTGTSGTSGTTGTSGTSGTGFDTISNPLDNRILTSDGTTNAANAESNLTFDGTLLNVYGDVTISGDLTISGTATYVNTQNLFVEDNLITLNATFSGTPFMNSGIEVNRGNETNASLIWNESIDLWTAGLSGSEVSILLNTGTGLVKNGSTVSLDFNSITGTGLTQNGSQLSIDTNGFSNTIAGGGLSSSGGTLSVNVGNGLEIVSDTVYLGGTLSQPTNIEVNGNTLTIESAGGQNQLFFDSSQITLNVSDGSGTASNINFQNTLTNWSYVIGGSESSVYLSNGLSSTDGSNNNGLLVRDSLNKKGIVYEDNYTSNFTTHSLVTKGYVDSAVPNVGAGNGLQELSPAVVGLGGTLSQTTYINGGGYDLTIGDVGALLFTSSIFDVEAGFVSIDAGTGSMQLIADGDVSLMSNLGQLSLGGNIGRVTTANLEGLVYTSDYTSTFITHSLVTKGYVDSAVPNVGAGNGLQELSPAVVGLGGTLSQPTLINGDSYDFTIGNIDSLTFTSSIFDVESDFISLDAGTGSAQLIANGSISIVSLNESIDLAAQSSLITISNLEGLVYASDYSSTFVTHSLVTKKYVDGAMLSGLTAGAGLTGGGGQGDVSLSIELDTNSGLTFSFSGDGGALKASVDGTSIGIDTSGQLYAISGSSTPVYQNSSPSNTSGDGSTTGLSLSQTPSQYSRIQVYVNGHLQLLGDGVISGVDCYFSSDGGTTAKNINSCVSGDTLYWNGNYTLFDLDTADNVCIVYES